MTEHHLEQTPDEPASYLESLSRLSAASFSSTSDLIQAVLEVIVEQLGLRTSFLTKITPEANCSTVIAAYNKPDGCDLHPGVTLALEDTY